MAEARRTSLLDLGDTELLLIASLLQRPIDEESHLPPEAVFALPSTELVNLSSVSSRARKLLAPLVLRSLVLGESERTKGYRKSLKALSKMDLLLCHVRHVRMLDIHRKAIKPLTAAMSKMVNLRYYTHAASVPILLPVAHLLRCLDHLLGGLIELKLISVTTHAEPPAFRDLYRSAPITVAHKRRMVLCGKVKSGPTMEEHTQALVEGLARLALGSKETLETIEVERGGRLTDTRLFEQLFDRIHEIGGSKAFPSFPQLRRFSLRKADCDGAALQHLLTTSPHLTHVYLVERIPKAVDAPTVPLVNLQSFHYLFLMDLGVSATVHAFAGGSRHLKELQLQGAHTKETNALFHPDSAIYSSIRILNLAFAGGALTRQNLLTILAACPQAVDLTLTAVRWRCSWAHLAKFISIGLHELETLDTDLPLTGGSGVVSSGRGGDGIRSRSAGDFRLLSALAGRLSDGDVLEMITADIIACRPFYLEKIAELASGCPTLRRVVLRVTSEVIWTSVISRDQAGQVQIENEPVVDLTK